MEERPVSEIPGETGGVFSLPTAFTQTLEPNRQSGFYRRGIGVDLEGLQETPVFFEKGMAARETPTTMNNGKNNKSKNQTPRMPGTSSSRGVMRRPLRRAGLRMVIRRIPEHEVIEIPHGGPKLNHGQRIALAREDLLPSDEVDKIRAIPIPLDDRVPDALYWPTSPGGMFSVREAYRYITGGDSSEDVDWVWKIKTSERCRMFLWLAVKDKLLTNSVRVKRQLIDDGSCMACGETHESVDHILKHCDVARVCWRLTHTPSSFARGSAATFSRWLRRNCSSADMVNGIPWGLTFSYTCWELWKARNRRIFEQVRPSPLEIVRRANFMARESLQLGHQRSPEPTGRMRWVSCLKRIPWICAYFCPLHHFIYCITTNSVTLNTASTGAHHNPHLEGPLHATKL
nr:LINE-type retrotransposon LIb DNA [Ipomoea batatas]